MYIIIPFPEWQNSYFRDDDDDGDADDVAVTSLVEIIPPKVELCPSQSVGDRRLLYTTSDMTAVVPKPEVRFRSGDGLQVLPHTCTHYGNASTNHSFALGTHRIVCRARDRRYGNHAVAQCEFDIHVIGTRKRLSILLSLYFTIFALKRSGKVGTLPSDCLSVCVFVCVSVRVVAGKANAQK